MKVQSHHMSIIFPCTGYGDNLNIMNSIHLLQQYVERQNKVWLSVEMDKGRGVDLADVEDPRVDLCLFCIQAHRLRPVDLRRVAFPGCLLPAQNSSCIEPCTAISVHLQLCGWMMPFSARSGVQQGAVEITSPMPRNARLHT